ncbi:hypothetical protein EVJ58_g5056 [Rhodofomes roseus]|uniref:F-box domain-containing protein n=1 Tax=Rhodofomes roseus TaxID=34475 RepID=A0A4Y9YG84_9APHY|nr:hypothetical protein EVJ58_g5056 [Rhodofomes roseus]
MLTRRSVRRGLRSGELTSGARDALQLPLEIWDHIVDFLHDDRDALLSCSRTCRALLPASRRHAFRHITLYNASRYHSFKAIVKKRNYVQPHVRILTIQGSDRRDRNYRSFPANGEWLHLLPRLSRLVHLRLRSFPFSIPDSLRNGTLTSVTSLRTLDLTSMGVLVSTPTSLVESVYLLFPVDDLRRGNINTFIWDPVAAASEKMLSLGAFVLHAAEQPMRRVAAMRIDSQSTPARYIQQLLLDSKDTIEELFLGFAGSEDAHGDESLYLDLCVCTRLRALHITCPIGRVSDVSTTLFTSSPQDAFTNLSSVVLRIVARKGTVHQFIEWPEFASDLEELCLTYPQINFTLCLDIRINDHFVQHMGGAQVTSLTNSYAELCSSLVMHLPLPSSTGGRVRFGLVWLWAGGDSLFWTTHDGRPYPPEYFLGDPQWYHSIQTP